VGGCIVQNKTTYSLESIYQIDVVKIKLRVLYSLEKCRRGSTFRQVLSPEMYKSWPWLVPCDNARAAVTFHCRSSPLFDQCQFIVFRDMRVNNLPKVRAEWSRIEAAHIRMYYCCSTRRVKICQWSIVRYSLRASVSVRLKLSVSSYRRTRMLVGIRARDAAAAAAAVVHVL